MKKPVSPLIFFPGSGRNFFVLSILFILSFQAYSQGDLLIYPKRLTFEGARDRIQLLHLNNKGKDSATYQISFVENRMHEDGKFEIIQEPDAGQLFASPYLRFYPRIITLAPNETQVIKVQLVKTNELSTGEYRSHLYFRSVPKPTLLLKDKEIPANPKGVSIDIKPVYGISVANIIRIGDPKVNIEICNLSFEKSKDGIPIISMDFTRNGDASSYGDLEVQHTSPEGKKTTVAKMNGFAVYTPGTHRHARIKLKPEDIDYNKGKLTVRYVSQETDGSLYAEGVLLLQGF